jgi:hypothetical protein
MPVSMCVVVLRLLTKVTQIIASQIAPDLLLQQIRATDAIGVTANVFDVSKRYRQQHERIWSYAMVRR